MDIQQFVIDGGTGAIFSHSPVQVVGSSHVDGHAEGVVLLYTLREELELQIPAWALTMTTLFSGHEPVVCVIARVTSER